MACATRAAWSIRQLPFYGAERAGIWIWLIFLNETMHGCTHKDVMSKPSTIAERLLAHARICRNIANATLNEETASKLERLAMDCIQAARDAEPESQHKMFPSAAGTRPATA